MTGFPPELRSSYTQIRQLPDGRWLGVHRLLFHWTMHVGISETGYEDRYCYATEEMAAASMFRWSGEGDPDFWHKHPKSNRYRDVLTGEQWDGRYPRPAPKKETDDAKA